VDQETVFTFLPPEIPDVVNGIRSVFSRNLNVVQILAWDVEVDRVCHVLLLEELAVVRTKVLASANTGTRHKDDWWLETVRIVRRDVDRLTQLLLGQVIGSVERICLGVDWWDWLPKVGVHVVAFDGVGVVNGLEVIASEACEENLRAGLEDVFGVWIRSTVCCDACFFLGNGGRGRSWDDVLEDALSRSLVLCRIDS